MVPKLGSISHLQRIFILGVVAISAVRAQSVQEDATVVPGRTTEAGEASVKDANQECQPYYYAPVATALNSFPPVWGAASILPEDGNAQAKWASIKPNVPDISPKGTLQGNFDGLNYPADDPDCWWTNTKCVTPKLLGVPPDVAILPEPHTLGYGFDDGPNCSHNAFYDYLASQKQRATMFYIGSNVMDWPLEAQRAVADGHEICVHSWSHQYMTAFSSEDAFAELYYSLQAVKIATGVTPTCWRPPFGDVDDRIRAIANGLGLRTVLWEYDSQDWQVGVTAGVTSDAVDQEYQNMINDAKNGKFESAGTMILAHELDDFTMSEAMKFYPILREAFQHIVPVAVGLNITQPYVEPDVVMPNFEQYTSGFGNKLVTNSTNSINGSAPTLTRSVIEGPSSSGQANNDAMNNGKKAAGAIANANAAGPGSTSRVLISFVLGYLCVTVLDIMHQ